MPLANRRDLRCYRMMMRVLLMLLVAVSLSHGHGHGKEAPAKEPKLKVVKQTEDMIAGLTSSNKSNNWPTVGALQSWLLSVNTFTHEVPSQSIADLYDLACRKLQTLYGDKVKTYRWYDALGYPGQVTLVQFKNEVRGNSYLIARVFEANDNDSFTFAYEGGTYDVSKKKLRKDWKLDNILRCNREKQ